MLIDFVKMEITDTQRLGIGLGGFGVFFLLLGILLFFDTGLLAIGNLFCIAGMSFPKKCRLRSLNLLLLLRGSLNHRIYNVLNQIIDTDFL